MADAPRTADNPRLAIPDGEWRLMSAAGYPLRVLSRDGALLFRAADLAAAAGVFIANGSTLRGIAPEGVVQVPRDEAGIIRKGAPVPFLTLAGAFGMLRRSKRPAAFILAQWLFSTATAAHPCGATWPEAA